MNVKVRFVIVVVGVIIALSAVVSPVPAQEPDVPPLAEPGPYGVGNWTTTFMDDTQDLELMGMIWYPAEAGSSSYLMPAYDAAPNASGAPYPLIVYSPTQGGYKDTLTAGKHLASHGFVVVLTEQADPNDWDVWPTLIDRPLNVLLVLDQIEVAVEGKLDGMIAFDNVGITGYDIGGTAAVLLSGARVDPEYLLVWCASHASYLCPWAGDWGWEITDVTWEDVVTYRAQFDTLEEGALWPAVTDERIRAVAPISPAYAALFGEQGLASVNVPTLLIGNAAGGEVPYSNAVFIYEHLSVDERYLISLLGVDWLAPLAGREDREVRNWYNHFLTAFFGVYLQGQEDYAAYLTPEFVEGYEMPVWGPVEIE